MISYVCIKSSSYLESFIEVHFSYFCCCWLVVNYCQIGCGPKLISYSWCASSCFEYIVHLCSIACCQIASERQIVLDSVRQGEIGVSRSPGYIQACQRSYISQFRKLLKAPTWDFARFCKAGGNQCFLQSRLYPSLPTHVIAPTFYPSELFFCEKIAQWTYGRLH